jgi:hypothetical protein
VFNQITNLVCLLMCGVMIIRFARDAVEAIITKNEQRAKAAYLSDNVFSSGIPLWNA